ncbi:MAG: peroxiredoxin-like family protein [Acidobacteriota bacterium]
MIKKFQLLTGLILLLLALLAVAQTRESKKQDEEHLRAALDRARALRDKVEDAAQTQESKKQEKTNTQESIKDSMRKLAEDMQKSMPPEAWETGERVGREAIAELDAKGAASRVLKVGDTLPPFTLNDAFGKPVSSADLLAKGPVVLVFHRGSWCPYCSFYLRTIQKALPKIRAYGASLVAIAGEIPSQPMKFEREELTFPALSDPKYGLSRKFGLVYEAPKNLNDYYVKIGKDLTEEYQTEKPELLMSAIYVIDRQGRITYSYVDLSYKNWPETSEILAALAKLR